MFTRLQFRDTYRVILGLMVAMVFLNCSGSGPSQTQPQPEKASSEKSTRKLSESDPILPELSLGEQQRTREQLANYQGTYLPEPYISELTKTFSHLRASLAVTRIERQEPHALMLSAEQLMKIYNYHEGVGEKIYKISDSTLSTVNGDLFEYEIFDDSKIMVDGILYKKVSDSTKTNGEAVGRFIVKSILGVLDLKNEKSHFSTDSEGGILYNGISFQYGVGLVFTSREHDYIRSKENTLYIDVNENSITIYGLELKDGEDQSDGVPSDATYEKIDEFTRQYSPNI